MQGNIPSSSFENLHFPQRTELIKKLRLISFVVNDIILVGSFLLLVAWLVPFFGLSTFLFQRLHIIPFTSVLFLLSGGSLLFGAKRHLMGTHTDIHKEQYAWWNTYIPIFLAGITAIFGLANVFHSWENATLSFIHISQFGGLCFFLIGVSLIPPFTRILHRFHYTQFLIFVMGGLNGFIILENIYQTFSRLPLQHIVYVPLPTALAFAFFSFGILLRWSNRGFFGNFTLDSTASMFALRLFLFNLLAAPFIAFIVLLLMQKTPYNMYQILTVVVILYAGLSCFLLWVNVKLLYRYDLEHLLMRESLRSHNIDLTVEKEELRKRMLQVEQEKQQYLDKLNVQNKWKAAVDTVG